MVTGVTPGSDGQFGCIWFFCFDVQVSRFLFVNEFGRVYALPESRIVGAGQR